MQPPEAHGVWFGWRLRSARSTSVPISLSLPKDCATDPVPRSNGPPPSPRRFSNTRLLPCVSETPSSASPSKNAKIKAKRLRQSCVPLLQGIAPPPGTSLTDPSYTRANPSGHRASPPAAGQNPMPRQRRTSLGHPTEMPLVERRGSL